MSAAPLSTFANRTTFMDAHFAMGTAWDLVLGVAGREIYR